MKPTFDVALTCVGGRLTYDLINAIRRAPDFKVNIIGMDLNANANGRFLCDQFFTIPNAETDQAHWFQSVLEIQHKTNFTGLIPLSEAEVKLTSSYSKAFAFNNVVTSVSDDLVVDIVNDKFHLMTTLQSEGIHVGPFHAINNKAELRQKITLLGYPDSKIVLKPRKGRGSRGVMILDANQKSFNALLPNRFCGHGCVETVIAAFRKMISVLRIVSSCRITLAMYMMLTVSPNLAVLGQLRHDGANYPMRYGQQVLVTYLQRTQLLLTTSKILQVL